MTLRETIISKVQELPEPLLQEVDRFIDREIERHASLKPDGDRDYAAAWEKWFEKLDANCPPKPDPQALQQWFEEVDRLEVPPKDEKPRIKPSKQEVLDILVEKYRQQGLNL